MRSPWRIVLLRQALQSTTDCRQLLFAPCGHVLEPDDSGSSRGVPPGSAGAIVVLIAACRRQRGVKPEARRAAAPEAMGLEFIDTGFERLALSCDVVDNVVRIHLLYDHERASPNRAAEHIISGFMHAPAQG